MLWAGLLLLVALALGCRRTKDSFTSRTFHEMTSRFNPLFNGNEALRKAVNTIESGWKDDFTKPMPVYRWGDEKQAAAVVPDLDKAIEKGTKVIRDHSMVIGNKQKNDYIDDSYLLIGVARFYKQEHFKALETFNYIIQSFPQEEVYFEAILWAARTQTAMENYFGAEDNLNLLYKNRKVPKELKVHVLSSWAQLNTQRKEYDDALANLAEALPLAKDKKLRVRLKYLQAQLLQLTDKGYEASKAFLEVIKMKPEYEYAFQAQLARARSFDVYMEDPAIIYKELNKMLKDDKNRENRDQIYYVLAEIALKLENYEEAEGYLKKSVRLSMENTTQKGLSYIKLADIDFEFKNYERAQAYYDSASAVLPKEHPLYRKTEKIRQSLNDLVANLHTIRLQDSLLALAALPSAKQQEVVMGIIQAIVDEQERKKQEEELGKMNEMLAQSGPQSGLATGAGGGGWYFYNVSVRSTGFTDFINRWGSRTLEDNWRRSSKKQDLQMASSDFAAEASAEGETMEGGEAAAGNDLLNPSFYLSKIPNDSAAQSKSHALIIHAFQELGRIYKTELNDLEQAAKSLEELLKRYPGDERMDRAYYALFLIYRELDKKEKANTAFENLKKYFPDSRYTAMAQDPEAYERMMNQKNSAAETGYLAALNQYQKEQFKQAMAQVSQLLEQYKEDALVPRMKLLHALCLGKLGKKDDFLAALEQVADAYPKDPAGIEAQFYLTQLGGGGNTGPAAEDGLFAFDLSKPHQFVLLAPVQGTNVNQLRNDITDYNANFHRLENLQMQAILLDESTHLIIVSGFGSAEKAMNYLNTLHLNEAMMTKMPQGYRDLVISLDNFKVMYTQKKVEQYLAFYQQKYKNLKP